MSGEDQAEARLRELLRDPRWSLPAGPDPEQRVRRAARAQRRRLAGLAGVAAAAAVIAVAIPAGVGVLGHPAGPAAHRRPATLYIYGSDVGSGANRANVVIPVNTATGTPGKPIHVGVGGTWPGGMIVITPNGKTAYVTTASGTIIPVNTATATPGKPIHIRGRNLGNRPDFIAITPDGKTAYVSHPGLRTVTPVNTATGTPGKPINIHGLFPLWDGQIVFMPGGKTGYVTTWSGTVTPINTATNAPGKPIHVGYFCCGNMAITPDGKTAYVTSQNGCRVTDHRCTYTVTPISTATGRPGKPIHVGSGPDTFTPEIVITPDGKTAYVTTGSGVTPISTATGTPGKPIHVVGSPFGHAIAITP